MKDPKKNNVFSRFVEGRKENKIKEKGRSWEEYECYFFCIR